MTVYNPEINRHTEEGARGVFELICADQKPASMLDVGCGPGVWLKAAYESGVTDLTGLDLYCKPDPNNPWQKDVRSMDLTMPWSLDRRYDLCVCVEVAEHLPHEASGVLIDSLTAHSDRIVFSAAAPRQGGENHINCQWPSFWQKLFNERGYSCSDALRWKMWEDISIEPWYRQNLFIATKAGEGVVDEPPIKAVYHPEIIKLTIQDMQENPTIGARKAWGIVCRAVRKRLGMSS